MPRASKKASTQSSKPAKSPREAEAKIYQGGGAAVAQAPFDPKAQVVLKDQSQGEVVAKSQSEIYAVEGSNTVSQVASTVARRWQEKESKEGRKVFACPFCPPSKENEFDTRPQAQKHIKTEHPNQVEVAKLSDMPKANYTPQLKIISPKRTIEDFITPDRARLMGLARQSHGELQNLQAQARQLSSKDMNPQVLVMMPESEAIEKVVHLSTDGLKEVARLAWSRGKQNLMKKIRTICKERGVALQF